MVQCYLAGGAGVIFQVRWYFFLVAGCNLSGGTVLSCKWHGADFLKSISIAQNFQPNKLCMQICRNGHKKQKKSIKIRLKELILKVLRSKVRIVEHFTQTWVCVSATFRNSGMVLSCRWQDVIFLVAWCNFAGDMVLSYRQYGVILLVAWCYGFILCYFAYDMMLSCRFHGVILQVPWCYLAGGMLLSCSRPI